MLNAGFTMQRKMLQIFTGRRIYSQMVGFHVIASDLSPKHNF